MHHTGHRLHRDRRGVVMMEFMIALLPVMLAFLGFTQFAFAAVAKLAVRHSAALATRAAIVVIEEAEYVPGAPANIYQGLPAGGLEVAKAEDKNQGGGQDDVGKVQDTAAKSDSPRTTMEGLFGSLDRTGSRMKQIRTAAYWPLLAVSPSVIDDGIQVAKSLPQGELFQKTSVKDAIGQAGAMRLVGAFLYNLGAVAVTFPEGPGSKTPSKGMFGPNDMVTTRVTYLFRCQVPLASLLMCTSGWALMFGSAWVDPHLLGQVFNTATHPPKNVQDLPAWSNEWKHTMDYKDRLQQRVDAFKGHEKDFDQVEWPFMMDALLALPGARYMVLSAEGQLPLQGARYYPRIDSQDMDKMWQMQADSAQDSTQLPDVRKGLESVATEAEALATKAVDSVATQVEAILDKGKSYGNDLKNKADGYTNDLQNQANGYIGDIQQQAGGTISQVQQAIGNAVGQVANPLASSLGGVIGDAAGAATDLKNTAGGYASDIKNTAGGYASDIKDTAGGYADELTSSAQGLGQDAEREVSGAARKLKKQGNKLAGDVKQEGNELAGDVKEAGRDGAQAIKDAAKGLPVSFP